MNKLDFEPIRMPCNIRPDQSMELETIKYEVRIERNIKISKAQIVRMALDEYFKSKNIDAIIHDLEN